MKVVIIEDEEAAANMLASLLNQLENKVEVIARLQSIQESVEWFTLNPFPDLVFMDIHLADGSSFVIFDKIKITCPVIFTTAYDEYALKAFQVNSIDYLLKPVSKEKLQHAINKFKLLSGHSDRHALDGLLASLRVREFSGKSHFLIHYKDKLLPLAVNDIAYIYTENKNVRAYTFLNENYMMDENLEELLAELDPTKFFRANRQFIVAHKAIKEASLWFGSKIVLHLLVSTPEKIVISKLRVPDFKKWYTGMKN